jgi:hypothetical protein
MYPSPNCPACGNLIPHTSEHMFWFCPAVRTDRANLVAALSRLATLSANPSLKIVQTICSSGPRVLLGENLFGFPTKRFHESLRLTAAYMYRIWWMSNFSAK